MREKLGLGGRQGAGSQRAVRLTRALPCAPQIGRCDGYILEGKELDFYMKKMQKKKKGQ